MAQPTSSLDLIHGKIPYGDIWRGMGNVIPGLIRTAQATPRTLRTLGQLQTGQLQAPAGPARGMQYLLQQADLASGKKGRVGFHPSDFTSMPGAIGGYYQRKYGTWGALGQNLRDDPVGTLADLSVVGAAPEDLAKGAAGLAGRVGAPAAVRDAITAARTVTRPVARVATAINPATPVIKAAGAATGAARGTLGLFDHTGAFTPRGLTQFQKLGGTAFPNGEITAAEYADPRFQAHMAPILQRKGFNPAAFKDGVISYSGAPTPTGPITGVRPRGAPAAQRTDDLIAQGHQAIDAKAQSIALPPKDMGTPNASQLREFANGPIPAKIGLTNADTSDLRLAAAGKDALDSKMVAAPPSLVGTVGPKLAKAGWQAGTTLGGLAAGAALAGAHAPVLGALADWVPEVGGAVGGFLFGKHAGAPGALGEAASGVADWSAANKAGAGAPTDLLDVPKWTADAAKYAGPAAISIGQNMDPGKPGPAEAPAPPPGEEAPPPGGWQAPPEYKPPDMGDDTPPAAPPAPASPEEAAPPDQSAAPPAPEAEPAAHHGGGDHAPKGSEHDQLAPPELQKLAPQAYTPADLDAPAPQADGGRVGFAVGGQVSDMTEHLLRRADAAQKAARSATKPLLGLSDDTVAAALRVAQRGL